MKGSHIKRSLARRGKKFEVNICGGFLGSRFSLPSFKMNLSAEASLDLIIRSFKSSSSQRSSISWRESINPLGPCSNKKPLCLSDLILPPSLCCSSNRVMAQSGNALCIYKALVRPETPPPMMAIEGKVSPLFSFQQRQHAGL